MGDFEPSRIIKKTSRLKKAGDFEPTSHGNPFSRLKKRGYLSLGASLIYCQKALLPRLSRGEKCALVRKKCLFVPSFLGSKRKPDGTLICNLLFINQLLSGVSSSKETLRSPFDLYINFNEKSFRISHICFQSPRAK